MVINMKICLILLACLVGFVLATNPGAQIRISQHGIQYAGNVLVQKLAEKFAGQPIPDINGKSGKVKYEFKNMRVTNFNPPQFTAKVNPGQGVSLTLSGATLSVHGDWRYKIKILFPISDSGSVDVSLYDVTITNSVVFGEAQGHPTVRSTGCSCNIGNVNIDIHSGLDWLYNLFKDYIEKKIESTLRDKLCELLDKEINEEAAQSLAELKMITKIGRMSQEDIMMNFSLVTAPIMGSQYVEAQMSGEIFMSKDTPGHSGLTPAPFQDTHDTTHMVNIWLSDFILDSFGFSLQKRSLLAYNFTKDDLKPKDQHFLDIQCDDSSLETKCVGSVVPKLRKIPKYANGSVVVGMWSTMVPRLNIRPGQLTGLFKGNMAFFVKPTPTADPEYVFTINVTASFLLQASMKGNFIHGKIARSRVRVDVIDSQIGPISDVGLQWIFNSINTMFIQDQLNKKGAEGVELPQIKNVVYVDPEFDLMANSLVVKANLLYNPPGK
uniref:BPI protein 2 n=1 Tax=Perinereis linea TaxID=2507842 RepID=A0A481MSN2_9ANNE|nr:BPI protein 2 [Perinereis linea]